ncbi:hypothetical protein [uncultured Chryseobacterium sp.]|uniref:hypothetical protein n=1 Tax=uncultured Chryseobacterium sp. TaxID=259322 RepID=UPI0025F16226|nr:hypothetical protein [uncultured Chryseobacterium sp.]
MKNLYKDGYLESQISQRKNDIFDELLKHSSNAANIHRQLTVDNDIFRIFNENIILDHN